MYIDTREDVQYQRQMLASQEEQRALELPVENNLVPEDDEEDYEQSRHLRDNRTVAAEEPGQNAVGPVLKNPDVIRALDRNKLTSRQAVRTLAPALAHYGIDINNEAFSHSTLHRERTKQRKEIANEIKENFKPPKRSIVHFDGKMLSELDGDFGDHLAVMLSGNSVQCRRGKLLSAKLIKDGTGESQAKEVISSLESWSATESVVGMCFDTTSSNTGWIQGASVRIEKSLKRPLMWLPCRYFACFVQILNSEFETF